MKRLFHAPALILIAALVSLAPTAVEYAQMLELVGVFVLVPGPGGTFSGTFIPADATVPSGSPHDVTLTLPYRFEALHDTVLEIRFLASIHHKTTNDVLGYTVIGAAPGTNGIWEGNLLIGLDIPPGIANEDLGNLEITTWFRTRDSEGRWQHYQPTTAYDPNYRWLQVNPGSVTTINTPLLPLIDG